jgi:hypothetical protein
LRRRKSCEAVEKFSAALLNPTLTANPCGVNP